MRKLLLIMLTTMLPLQLAATEETIPTLLPTSFNHLHSALIVSPAQLYTVQGLQTDLTLGFRKSDHETIITSGKWDFEWMSSILNLTAVTNLPLPGLNIGLNINSMLSEPEEIIKGEGIPELLRTSKQSAHTKYTGINTLQISPLFSYHLKDMIALGLRLNYQYVDRNYSTMRAIATATALHDSSNSFSIMPAFTVTATDFDAGVMWQTAESGNDVEVPATLTMHGRYTLASNLHLGGVYQLKRYSAIKSGHDDQSVLRATVAWQHERLRVEGDVAYATAHYRDQTHITAHNIATFSTHTALDYRLTENAIAGAAVGYTFGKEIAGTPAIEYNMQEMDFALRGNYLF